MTMLIVSLSSATALLLLLRHYLYVPPLRIASKHPAKDLEDQLDAWLTRLHKSQRFNGSALLLKGDRVLLHRQYGNIDAFDSRHLDARTRFNLASVSKQFTAMGIVLLASRGRLKLTDRLAYHIPELDYLDTVTLTHLLHHCSGVPDYLRLVKSHQHQPQPLRMAQVIELFAAHRPRGHFSPGTRFRYSNTGYVLLAAIIERATGLTFAEFMQQEIFNPLDMTDSCVYTQWPDTTLENRAFGFRYRLVPWGQRKEPHDLTWLDGITGDGGIYSTAADLHKWHCALLTGSLVPKSDYAKAYQAGRLNDGNNTRYGYGWFIHDQHSVEHQGGWRGFSSYLWHNHENGDLVVLLDNSTNPFRVNAFGSRYNSIGLNLIRVLQSLPTHHRHST